eukprot:gene20673-21352_t
MADWRILSWCCGNRGSPHSADGAKCRDLTTPLSPLRQTSDAITIPATRGSALQPAALAVAIDARTSAFRRWTHIQATDEWPDPGRNECPFGNLSILLFSSFLLVVSNSVFRELADQRLKTGIAVLSDSVHSHGTLRRVGDQLYFGDLRINGNSDLMDRIGAVAGGSATIFLGDSPIATSLRNPDGSRALDVRAPIGKPSESVMPAGNAFHGEVEMLGDRYLAIYEPLRDGTTTVGALAFAVKTSDAIPGKYSLIVWALGSAVVLFVIVAGLTAYLTGRVLM